MKKIKKTPIPEIVQIPRTDAIYNCHGYLTKIPVMAIIPFIECYSEAEETVADTFAGSGMTAIASVLTNRNAIVSDISVLGQHIAQGYLSEVNHKDFINTANQVIASAREKINNLYQTVRIEDNKPVELVRTIWSSIYSCPKCDHEFNFFNNAILSSNEKKDICIKCGEKFNKRKWNLNPQAIRRPDVPVRVVVYSVKGKQVEQPIQSIDLENIFKANNDKRLQGVPSLEIKPDREMYSRSGLRKKGISETKDFFSARNAIALKELWDAINKVDDSAIRKKLQFVFTAILPRASKRYQWSKLRPLNAQNQTYYISPVYFEWNVFQLFLRKVNSAIRSDKLIFNNNEALLFKDKQIGKANYHLASADSLNHLKSNSVDYIFTDPPFGSNIFYSDMSLFHEAWLGTKTDNKKEAVIHTCGKKKNNAAENYENLLRKAFQQAYRVLKPGRFMSVVFGNSKGSVWSLVLRALRDAGFDSVPDNITILDKGQRSVKGLSSGSESVVTLDLILTTQKPLTKKRGESNKIWEQADPDNLISDALQEFKNNDLKNPSYIYAKVLREAIKRHLLVDNLHLSDVLIALRKKGYSIDSKTGLLISPTQSNC